MKNESIWKDDLYKGERYICKACGYVTHERKGFIELSTIIRHKGYGRCEEVQLYACPKCGTVHMEV